MLPKLFKVALFHRFFLLNLSTACHKPAVFCHKTRTLAQHKFFKTKPNTQEWFATSFSAKLVASATRLIPSLASFSSAGHFS